jgi:3-deoxy-D-manno-octulosonic-acid transferase
VSRFLAHFQPRIGLLVETEVWPNMAAACLARGIPLCLVNARMNAQSLARARSLAWLARPAYGALRAVWAQAQPDAERLAALGAPVRGVFGNFKFDATPDAQQWKTGRDLHDALGRPVAVFANSRDGEELMFLEALKKNRALALVNTGQGAINSVVNFEIQWLLVPRHPQRFDEVAALCAAQGFSVSRRSQWQSGPQDADIWLGDSLGEMAMYYALADVALLGGSFAPLGGHNLIEATACECPVFMGPHTFNFAQAAELAVAAGAAFECADLPPAMDRALGLLRSTPGLTRARQAARDMGLAHRGAAKRTARAVQDIVTPPSGS